MKSVRNIDVWSATSMVVANMIGTGVFTSLGYQLFDNQTGFSILMIWVIGGIIALTGAFAYAEIAGRLSQDGGEFHFLSEIFHPALGYMAGFVSTTVGFAAPVAGAALALGAYLQGVFPQINGVLVGVLVIIAISILHSFSLSLGLLFQRISTFTKVLLMLVFIGSGWWLGNKTGMDFSPNLNSLGEVFNGFWFTAGFSVSLVWVSFAYSGWNAAAYIAGSIENPQRNLSRSILMGTLIVMVLYALLNMVFLTSTPMEWMKGKKEVGLIAAEHIWGSSWGKLMGGVISILLVSTISSMIFTGPRVLRTMLEKIPMLRYWSALNKNGIPSRSIILQGIMSIVLLHLMNFESLIYYVAFTLSLFTLLTVLGLFKLRIQHGKPEGYKAWGYPITPLFFLVMTASVCLFFIKMKPFESVLGCSTGLVGLLFWYLSRANDSK
jgi:basic amino acid/polyamine antiporter, APA family